MLLARGRKVIRGYLADSGIIAMNETLRRRRLYSMQKILSFGKSGLDMSSLMNSATPEKLLLQSTRIKSMKLAKNFKVILTVMSLFVLKTVKRSKQHDGCEERCQFWRSQPSAVSSSDREELNTSRCKRPSCDSCCKP